MVTVVAAEAAELPHDEPALVEWQSLLPGPQGERGQTPGHYRGRVVLFTSTLNMDWNSWPVSPSFAPLMQELLRYAVSGRLREQAVTVGDPLEEFLPIDLAGRDVTVQTPDPGHTETTRTQESPCLIRRHR